MTKPSQSADSARPSMDDAAAWWEEMSSRYKRLGEKVERVLSEVMDSKGIEGALVTSRRKEKDKLVEKAERYKSPRTEIHDFCGVRVVTSFPSQARTVAGIVRELFEIDEANSVDKALDLGVDRVGYQAVHFVAQLRSDRAALPEWSHYSGLKFEVQVRTILQDAWAEFEHDRNYKFAGDLPPEIERPLKLAAGLLEVADREFDRLAAAVDKYAASVSAQTSAAVSGPKATLRRRLDIAVNSVSLRGYIQSRFRRLVARAVLDVTYPNSEAARQIVDELRAFGVITLSDLEHLIPADFEAVTLQSREETNILGLCRSLMIVSDARRYFLDAWNLHWTRWDESGVPILTHYGVAPETLLEFVSVEGYDDSELSSARRRARWEASSRSIETDAAIPE